ncbi:hypothetical protein [Bordetella sp. N]|uniref:hypothetical protein n=1 Tax=Bordetella sp. N TaxID=1746199 RepID=UPI000708A88A|nr:hypothetical protein [Bordetella sp. N]ALM81979.1 hypothetical protein ASB57_02455 [Bordetella sp. N]
MAQVAQAQVEPGHAVQPSGWVLERDAAAPLYRARMAGQTHYLKNSPGNATLAFGCRPDTPGVFLELAFDPARLGFKTDDYEGPDATLSGPITFAGGNGPALAFPVAGWFGDGGPFDTGIPFIFGVNRGAAVDAQIRRWLAPSIRGQALQVTIPAADKGEPLIVQFRWPDDDAIFRRVVSMCVKPEARPGR